MSAINHVCGFGRRRFLRGVGGSVLALPFLESFGPRSALAAATDAPATRFVLVFHPQGTIPDRWRPKDVGTAWQPSPLLEPLRRHKGRVSAISGLRNAVVDVIGDTAHNAAARSLLTCQTFSNGGKDGHAAGPSIDQVLARRMTDGARRPYLSLRITGKGLMQYQILYAGKDSPAGGMADPWTVYEELFGGAPPAPGAGPAPTATLRDRLRRQRVGVLSDVNASFRALQGRVSATDWQRLELHAEKIREIEKALQAAGTGLNPSATCKAPTLDLPRPFDIKDELNEPLHSRIQMKLAALALACSHTRVVSIQFVAYQNPTFPYLKQSIPGPYGDWHSMIHRLGRKIPGWEDIVSRPFLWYGEQVAILLDELASLDEGGRSVLDSSAVLWLSEYGDGGAHSTRDLPVVLAGGLGGRLRTDRHESFPERPMSDLYLTLLRAFGGDDQRFGIAGADPGRGPITELLA